MIESILQKAIQSSGQSYSYSPQQVAVMLDIHTKNINVLDHKIMMVQLFWFAVILGSVVLNLILFYRFEKQLKRLKKGVYS